MDSTQRPIEVKTIGSMMKRKLLVLAGLVAGLAYGIWPVIKAYQAAPSFSGIFELAFQILIVCVFAGFGALIGFSIGFVWTLLQKRGRT